MEGNVADGGERVTMDHTTGDRPSMEDGIAALLLLVEGHASDSIALSGEGYEVSDAIQFSPIYSQYRPVASDGTGPSAGWRRLFLPVSRVIPASWAGIRK